MDKFVADYRIPDTVGLRYCGEGEWSSKRKEGEVVIPIIAFLEGGMRIPMGPVMRGYLTYFRLTPTQCASNMFRILGSVDALNEKMGLRLTHHDVNYCYNLQHLKNKSYYMRTRDDRVRLIQCLPESNKGMNEDFLIVSGAWHDGLHCPTTEWTPGGAVGVGGGSRIQTCFTHHFFLYCLVTNREGVFFLQIRTPTRAIST